MNPRTTLLLAVFLLGPTGTSFAAGPSGGAYALERSVLAPGGSSASTGGIYQLGGSIAQTDAASPLAAGVYQIDGGFWSGTSSSTVDADPIVPSQLEFGMRVVGANPFRASTAFAITLPQASLVALPPLLNEATFLLKASPAIAVIGIVDLTRVAARQAAYTYDPLPAMLVALAIYFFILSAINLAGRRLEVRLRKLVPS